VVADLDNDGQAEVIFTSWPQKGGTAVGQLHILSSLGVSLYAIDLPPSFSAGTWNGGLGAPTLANIDGDPDLEVVVGTAHSGVVAYDLPGTAAAQIRWRTGRGSAKRTGVAKADVDPPIVGFVDVPACHALHSFITSLVSAGVTGGCAVNPARYCPDSSVTRAQMALFLLRAKGGPSYLPPACTNATFSDVPCSNPFAAWIYELVARGITTGCGGGRYCPNDPVTRAQMAVFLLLTYEPPGYVPPACTTATFSDVPCSDPFARWIYELVARGITAGCGGGGYCPASAVTRGQMAVFLVRTFSLP